MGIRLDNPVNMRLDRAFLHPTVQADLLGAFAGRFPSREHEPDDPRWTSRSGIPGAEVPPGEGARRGLVLELTVEQPHEIGTFSGMTITYQVEGANKTYRWSSVLEREIRPKGLLCE